MAVSVWLARETSLAKIVCSAGAGAGAVAGVGFGADAGVPSCSFSAFFFFYDGNYISFEETQPKFHAPLVHLCILETLQ